MSSVLKQYDRPVAFFVLATILPWLLWLGAGWVGHLEPAFGGSSSVASILAFAGLLVPTGIVCKFSLDNKAIGQDILHRLLTIKGVPPIYGLLALTIMPISILAAQAISLLFGYSASQFVITGDFSFTSGVFPVWFLLIVAPTIEELAWHSYGTDALRNRFSLLTASLIFAAFWAVWHIPLTSIKDYYHSNLVDQGALYAINFMLSIFPFVILMNWLYYKTNRNILVACVFHITAGYFNEIFATHPDSKVIQTALLSLLALAVVLRERAFFLEKDTITKN